MKTTFAPLALAATLAIPAAAFAETAPVTETAAATPAHAVAGHMLYSTGGRRLAPVYRVLGDGSAQLILNGRLVTVPASTLTDDGGKVTTTLTLAQLSR